MAPLQGVATVAIEVEPRASRDEDLLAATAIVEEPFEQASPAPVLVHLVENPEQARWHLSPQQPVAVLRDVPVQVAFPRVEQAPRKRGFSDLAGAGDEDHLPAEVGEDLSLQVSDQISHGHSVLRFSPIGKNTDGDFRLRGDGWPPRR